MTKHTCDLVIVSPVLNDWASYACLVQEIHMLEKLQGKRVVLIAVDDGSTSIIEPELIGVGCVQQINIVRLNANQGHQRAIAIGMAQAWDNYEAEAVIVMDSDGEDATADIPGMYKMHQDNPGLIIVAERKRRSEGIFFKLFYQLYKLLFSYLTGKSISFGNFSLTPWEYVPNILYCSGIWNNFAATLLKSRVPITYLATDRGDRFQGKSKMGFTGLMLHGLSAIAVFSDVVIGRIIATLSILTLILTLAVIGVVGFKLFSDVFVPGYATYVILFLSNLLFVTLFIGFLFVMMLLSRRDKSASLPMKLKSDLIREVRLRDTMARMQWTAE